MLLSWNFTNLVLSDLPGWEAIKREHGHKIIASVWLEHIRDSGKQSYDIAVEWDDFAAGAFYYRDHTESSLPIVRAGETYWSMFSFQFKGSAMIFQKRYSGHGNWQDGYDEMLHAWQKKHGRCGCKDCSREMVKKLQNKHP